MTISVPGNIPGNIPTQTLDSREFYIENSFPGIFSFPGMFPGIFPAILDSREFYITAQDPTCLWMSTVTRTHANTNSPIPQVTLVRSVLNSKG